jgi:hypothetical protein
MRVLFTILQVTMIDVTGAITSISESIRLIAAGVYGSYCVRFVAYSLFKCRKIAYALLILVVLLASSFEKCGMRLQHTQFINSEELLVD